MTRPTFLSHMNDSVYSIRSPSALILSIVYSSRFLLISFKRSLPIHRQYTRKLSFCPGLLHLVEHLCHMVYVAPLFPGSQLTLMEHEVYLEMLCQDGNYYSLAYLA